MDLMIFELKEETIQVFDIKSGVPLNLWDDTLTWQDTDTWSDIDND